MTQALTIPTPATLAQAVEFGIGAWIHEKFGHTRSEKTKMSYSETILAFRQLLQREGLDLTWPPSEVVSRNSRVDGCGCNIGMAKQSLNGWKRHRRVVQSVGSGIKECFGKRV